MQRASLLLMVLFLMHKVVLSQRDSLQDFNEEVILEEAQKLNLNAIELNVILKAKRTEFIKSKLGSVKNLPSNFDMTSKSSTLQLQNIDFEAGDFTGWILSSGFNFNNPGSGSSVVNGGVDPNVGIGLNSPLGGKWVARINPDYIFNSVQNRIRAKISVNPLNNLLKFAYATVLNASYHECELQPYFAVLLKDTNENVLFKFLVQAKDTLGGNICLGHNQTNFSFNANKSAYYSDWSQRCVDLTPYLGQNIYLDVIGAGCGAAVHWGYGYFDAKLETCPDYGYPNLLSVNNYSLDFNKNYIQFSNPSCAESLTLVAPAWPASYNWNGPAGSNIYNSNQQILTSKFNGLYTLAMGNSTTCPITKSLLLQSNPNFTVTNSGPFCLNTRVTISLIGAPTCTWNGNFVGTQISITPTATGIHTLNLNLRSKSGCIVNTTYTYNVNPLPSISVTGPSGACVGSTPTLIANGASTYSWYSSWFGNSTTYSFTSTNQTVTPSQILNINGFSNTISVTGTSSAGCVSRTIFTIVVSQPLPTLLTGASPSNASLCAGDPLFLSLNCSPFLVPPNTLTITNGITTQTFSNSAAFVTQSLSPLSTTNYSIQGSNYCGSVTNTISVIVNTLTPNISITALSPYNTCNYSLSLNGADSYSIGQVPVTGSVAVLNNPPNYAIYVTGSYSNSACIDTKTFIPAPLVPTLSLLSNAPVCYGSTVNYTIVGGGGIYTVTPLPFVSPPQFTTTSVFTTSVSQGFLGFNFNFFDGLGCLYNQFINLAAGTPTLNSIINSVSTDNFTICSGQSATISITGAKTYTWNTGSNSTSLIVSPTVATIYTVQGSSDCSISSKTIAIYPVSSPPGTISISSPVGGPCKNSVFTVSASGANSYTWITPGFPNQINSSTLTLMAGINPTVFICSFKDFNGCIAHSAGYTVTPYLPVIQAPANDTLCSPVNTTYSVSGANSYTWSANVTQLGANYSIIPHIGSSYSFTQQSTSDRIFTFSVSGQDVNGCVNTSTFIVIAYTKRPLYFKPPITKCPGISDTLIVTNNLLTPYSYTWSTGVVSNSITVSTILQLVYTVQAKTNAFGCISQGTIQPAGVFVLGGSPVFSLSTNSVCEGGNPISLAISSPTFSNVIFNGLNNPVFYPSVPGIFPIHCYYYDVNGCYNQSSTQSITVISKPNVAIGTQLTHVCQDDSITLSGSPPGGTFMGVNVLNNNYVPLHTSTGSVVYTFTNSSGCANFDQACFYVSECTSHPEMPFLDEIRVYPNPFSDLFYIKNEERKRISLTITDINSRIIYSETIVSSQTLNMEMLPPGMFFIVLFYENKTETFKLIKNP